MSTGISDITDIRRQMAQIRRELHEDVRDVVATAEAVTDWRRHLRNYPWVVLGGALAAGYLIVPKRDKTSLGLADIARFRETVGQSGRDVIESLREMPQSQSVEERKRKRGLAGAVLGMVTPIALKYAQNYALKFAENWLHQQLLQQQFKGYPSHSGPASGANPPGSQGPRSTTGTGPNFGPV